MSDSDVFARLVPVLGEVTLAGGDFGGIVEVGGLTGGAATCGAEDVRATLVADEEAPGFAELGRLVQASSSKPLTGVTAELDLGGGWTGADEELVIGGEVARCMWPDAVDMASKSTDGGGAFPLGCGLPLRVLFNVP